VTWHPVAVPSPQKVITVVVAYDRRDLLLAGLDALAAQTRRPDLVVVLDNASTDGTPAAVREWSATHDLPVDLVELPRNTGGAGGFAAGLARAVHRHGADAVWLMDDDTVPTPGALAAALKALHDTGSALVASRVVWTDGRDHPMNTPRERPGVTAAERAAAAGHLPIRSASFVALLLDAAAVRADGLPEAAFFLWNDDFEFSTRLLRHRRGVWCRDSVVEHRTKTFGSTDADPGERFVLEVRNKLWTFTRSRPLDARDTLLYGGATARRWVRTIARSRRRDVLLKGLASGLRQGITRPAATADVLADLGEVSEDVRAVEVGAGRAQLVHDHGGVVEGFSVLLPVWAGDDRDQLDRALRSVTTDQTMPPDEVVVVRDGPVPAALQSYLDGLTDVRLLELPENVGLARALEEGLRHCTFDVVARMDADDISLPERFAEQLPLIAAGADLVGAGLLEIGADEDDVVGRRVPPTGADEIARYARFHDPFNHPTVVYRRSAVAAAGGYRDLDLMEDYWLFARMIAAGARVENLPHPLVKYRVGASPDAGSYARRGGLRLFRSELTLQRHLRREGFTTVGQAARNVVVRGGYRFVPTTIRTVAYRALIARGKNS
jgi:GT2 family glycosyltransferase